MAIIAVALSLSMNFSIVLPVLFLALLSVLVVLLSADYAD